jgi:hypothetical protein
VVVRISHIASRVTYEVQTFVEAQGAYSTYSNFVVAPPDEDNANPHAYIGPYQLRIERKCRLAKEHSFLYILRTLWSCLFCLTYGIFIA